MNEPVFPPMMSGLAVDGAADPFDVACQKAMMGCDAGLIVHKLAADKMGAALVFAPEVPLHNAVAMLPVCAVGFQNALGALAPPEVAVHLEWSGETRINGARCGRFRMTASDTDAAAVPDWLVVGFELPLMLTQADPGDDPDTTVLYEEGCADVEALALLESWARHALNWIARWESDGTAPVHAEWRGLAHGIGEAITMKGRQGTFLGVDEDFGMLFRVGDETELFALTTVLEDSA